MPDPPIAGLSSWLPDDAFNPAPSLEEEDLARVRETMQALQREVWVPGDVFGVEDRPQDVSQADIDAGASCF